MILADTSAWVEFDRATGSAADERLAELIEAGGRDLAVTEPVMMEVLAGARTDKRSSDLRRLLTSFRWIAADPVADFEGAATLYRQCRSAGVTPRGLIDCMIATISLRSGAELLAVDGDFEAIADVVPLRLA
jgi:predicted nucleic acid-binding protein